MKKVVAILIILVLLNSLYSTLIYPDEGMWLLTQLEKLPFQEMKRMGLELSAQQIFNKDETSLTQAIVSFGGGTGSFISADGLILTNHHVAFSAIQSISTKEQDYLKEGFYAKTREEERSIPTYTARIVIDIKDVTQEVLSVVNDTMSAEERLQAIQKKSREIEKNEKGDTEEECSVSETFNGVKYLLYKFKVFKDVRLVYAPPISIGNYGGEIDNWYWPRHTGDFSLMRAYVAPDGKPAKYSKDNVPYKPKVFLPISTRGFSEGTFAMIIGFPGRTFRYRTTPEIKLAKEETLPYTRELFKIRMDIMEKAGKSDRDIEIKFANRWRGLANTYKNYEGTLEGMRRANILSLKQEEEEKFKGWISSRPELYKKYGTVFSDIADTYEELKSFNKKQILFNQIMSGVDMVRLAGRFKEFAATNQRSEEKLSEIREFIKSVFKNAVIDVDKEILVALILKAIELPENQQIEIVKKIVGNKKGEKCKSVVKDFVDDLYDDSKLTTPEGCEKLLSKSSDYILKDDFVEFFIELDKDNSALRARASQFNAKIGLLRKKLLEAWTELRNENLYPDANGTIRMTYGQVKSYKPRDAVYYDYVTTLSGVIEKETGEDPFIVPPKLRQLWETKYYGEYIDPRLNDIPVAFLANLDITGGNSGSPVINGKGELIGLAFDGNWEAVVGDYIYQEPLNRSINVDARYILFILDKFSNALNILNELTIR